MKWFYCVYRHCNEIISINLINKISIKLDAGFLHLIVTKKKKNCWWSLQVKFSYRFSSFPWHFQWFIITLFPYSCRVKLIIMAKTHDNVSLVNFFFLFSYKRNKIGFFKFFFWFSPLIVKMRILFKNFFMKKKNCPVRTPNRKLHNKTLKIRGKRRLCDFYLKFFF